MQAMCPSCKTAPLETPWERDEAMLCHRCATRYGVQPMHPARRPARPIDARQGYGFLAIGARYMTEAIDYEIETPHR